MRFVPVHVDLAEEREADVVVRRAERTNLVRIARLLATELVAREAENGEAALHVLTMQRFETLVLRREAALARRVHDEQDLSAIVVQGLVGSIEGLDLEFVGKGGTHGAAPLARGGRRSMA